MGMCIRCLYDCVVSASVPQAGFYLDDFCTDDPDHKHQGTYWGYWQVVGLVVHGLTRERKINPSRRQGWQYYNFDPVLGSIDTKVGCCLSGCTPIRCLHAHFHRHPSTTCNRTKTIAFIADTGGDTWG